MGGRGWSGMGEMAERNGGTTDHCAGLEIGHGLDVDAKADNNGTSLENNWRREGIVLVLVQHLLL